MVKRRFLLGEEWLYYKIYCGVRTADTILKELVLPLKQKLFEEELISKWFFIRYGDPDPHLRLRFKLVDLNDLSKIVSEINSVVTPYLDENIIWNVQVDTYNRELERYGSNTMEIAENLFWHDSEFVLDALTHIKDEELYFFCTLISIDDFVNEFGFNDAEKLEFYKTNAQAYKTEFNIGKITKLDLDKKYRGSKELFDAILEGSSLEEASFNIINKILASKKTQMASLIKELLNQKNLEIELNDLMTSYIHMNVNRTFRDRQRFYEMLGYDFLVRFQNSKLKKQKAVSK